MKRFVWIILAALVVVGCLLSLHLGHRMLSPADVWAGLFSDSNAINAVVARGLRLPRMVTAGAVGMSLGLAGLVMQTVMRNALAEPGLLGVNAGAGLSVVTAYAVFGVTSLALLALIAVLGAGVAVSLVFGIAMAAGRGAPPVYFLLAGVTVAALMASVTQIILLTDEVAMEAMLFWLSGGFADRGLDLMAIAAIPMIILAIAALAFHRQLDVLQTDDETAQALGLPILAARLGALALAAGLAGLSVSVAGPVAFVGLIAPHIARQIVRPVHAELAPASMMIGATLALFADVLARLIAAPQEVPAGAVLAIVGVPVLIALLRRGQIRGVSV